jgi:hypothetical protein
MKVTECGSATGVGLFHVTLSPALISILSGTKIVRGEVLFPPPAAYYFSAIFIHLRIDLIKRSQD